tara:strand:- start:1237 stop:1665 length:429 start_codon:yes stop_codon:yes gene_type:complete
MSVRLYIGNLPQQLNPKEIDSLLKNVSAGIRFKPVFSKETKECRGFGFATTTNEKVADLVIEQLNGHDFNGSKLRVERSEKKDSSNNSRRSQSHNGNSKSSKRKDFKKVVHSDTPATQSPDPRWAGELSKLKELLANQKTPV